MMFIASPKTQFAYTIYEYKPPHDKINKMDVRPAKTDQTEHPLGS